jgi:NAD+ kinase
MIFDKIGIITNEKKDPQFKHTDNLIKYLSDKKTKIYTNQNDLYEMCDLIIVLGGDGTMLKAAAKAAKAGIPLIGINLGRIGFMSEIEADELHLLDNLFFGGYEIKNRMMLDVKIVKSKEETSAGTALNDAVVTNGIAKLIEIGLDRNGAEIAKYMADGVIAATPTGSTAYSMSAGGPIIDPELECFCVTPICPHSLFNRSLIFSGDSVLEITNRNTNSQAYLTVDGQASVKLDENDIVKITRSKFAAKLVSIKKHGFIDFKKILKEDKI